MRSTIIKRDVDAPDDPAHSGPREPQHVGDPVDPLSLKEERENHLLPLVKGIQLSEWCGWRVVHPATRREPSGRDLFVRENRRYGRRPLHLKKIGDDSRNEQVGGDLTLFEGPSSTSGSSGWFAGMSSLETTTVTNAVST